MGLVRDPQIRWYQDIDAPQAVGILLVEATVQSQAPACQRGPRIAELGVRIRCEATRRSSGRAFGETALFDEQDAHPFGPARGSHAQTDDAAADHEDVRF